MNQTQLVAWDEKRPAPLHFVMASYSILEPLRLMKTCRRGCCVDGGLGPQMLPRYWRDATKKEINDGWPKKNVFFESLY